MAMPSTHTPFSPVPAGLGKAFHFLISAEIWCLFSGFRLLLGITVCIPLIEKTRPEASSAAVSAAPECARVGPPTEVNRTVFIIVVLAEITV